MDDRLKRVKERVAKLLEEHRILIDENFELKMRVAKLEDALAKVLNSADKFTESLFECRKTEMVDVVRCKDCKYRNSADLMCGNARDDWFCADGERGDNNG